MQRIRPDVDVILDVLHAVLKAQPDSTFVSSLLIQYQERGGLSKKQLQGLYGKASRLTTLSPGKLATLEAIILKKHTKYKSDLPEQEPETGRDEKSGNLIQRILEKFPAHKRVLFLKSKYDGNEALSSLEVTELEKFSKLLK